VGCAESHVNFNFFESVGHIGQSTPLIRSCCLGPWGVIGWTRAWLIRGERIRCCSAIVWSELRAMVSARGIVPRCNRCTSPPCSELLPARPTGLRCGPCSRGAPATPCCPPSPCCSPPGRRPVGVKWLAGHGTSSVAGAPWSPSPPPLMLVHSGGGEV